MDLILEFAVGAAVVAKGWVELPGNGFRHSLGGAVNSGDSTSTGRTADRRDRRGSSRHRHQGLLAVLRGHHGHQGRGRPAGGHRRRLRRQRANFSPFIPPTETGKGAAGTGIDQSVFSLLTGGGGSHYGWYGVLAGASIVFFAFIGFDVVATTAGGTRNPQRDVARGILASARSSSPSSTSRCRSCCPGW